MKIRVNEMTRRIVVRSVEGEKLDKPIDVEFDKGFAEVAPEVGKRLAGLFPGVSIVRDADPEQE